MKKYILGLSLALMPMLTLGATGFSELLGTLSDLIATAMPILLSLAVLFFVYSLVMYLLKAGEEKKDAKTQMIWGIVILFVMVSVWGLVNVLVSTADLDTTVPDFDYEITTS
ncbi:MAG: hypothetical protein KAR54_01025 [Candidatus Pacebacteria bacterium]|nr:hypothetical protein [Candidatus Paceibacterota bacterium]